MKEPSLFLMLFFSAALFIYSCDDGDDDDIVESCLETVDNEINTFTWANTIYDVSGGNSSNFVICADGEIDAFWSANASNEITFGFKERESPITVSVENGLPSPEIILTQGNATYVAMGGTVAPCSDGYNFSLTLEMLSNPNDLSTGDGLDKLLTGNIKCN
uniref:Uncharacterized protein n=1 Tax=Roseihalotalea indica TaxID=2867963 RepID=A0AA49PZV9_9BACT|nr:hypothetical protein K4G66_13760 [Tunicatimonas sp. TK19036]